MATDILFNFYDILVNTIFGSAGLAILAVGVLLFLILMICRASQAISFQWIMMYFIVMYSFYFGTIGLAIGFIIGVVYVIWEVIRLNSGGGK